MKEERNENDWIDDLPEVNLSERTKKELSELLAQENYSLTDQDIEIIEGYIMQGLANTDDNFCLKQKRFRERRSILKFSDSFNSLHPVDRQIFSQQFKEQFSLSENIEVIEQKLSLLSQRLNVKLT